MQMLYRVGLMGLSVAIVIWSFQTRTLSKTIDVLFQLEKQ